jgi:hypothetical protein
MYIPLLVASLAFAVACDIEDVITSEKCFAKGAVETNTFLIGDNQKPSAVKLYLRDSVVLALCVLPSALCATVFHNLPLAYGGLIAPVIFGVKHLLGVRYGKAFLAGKSQPTAQSWWQKLLQG